MAETRDAEVPDALKRLVHYVLSGFYTQECSYVMDLLLHHPCIKEEDLEALTRFDKKQLRACLNSLKTDQFVGCRMQLETGEDKKSIKHNYYYIRYPLFINVVKYKLHCMREKIEEKEKESIYRDTFKCPTCLKTFNDLDAGDLFDQASGTFKCTLCGSVVEEQSPGEEHHNLMAVFNEEMKPVFDCLQQLDNVVLHELLLNPIPIKDLASRTKKARGLKDSSTTNQDSQWSGSEFAGHSITINNNQTKSNKKSNKKSSPTWIRKNNIQATFNNNSNNKNPSISQTIEVETKQETSSNHDIIKTLLTHEKTDNDDQASKPSFLEASESRGMEMEEEDEEEEEEDGEFYVTIKGVATPYNDVTPEMVAAMTQEEKDEYIRVGREMHEYFDG